MQIEKVSHTVNQSRVNRVSSERGGISGEFKAELKGVLMKDVSRGNETHYPSFTLLPHNLPDEVYSDSYPVYVAMSAYEKSSGNAVKVSKEHVRDMNDIEKYMDDQLLSNPGGDNYYLDEMRVEEGDYTHNSFISRVGKDIKDAFSNIRNLFMDMFTGSKVCYRGRDGTIKQHKRRGLFSAIGDFFKDLGSALTFGAWRPDGEAEPKGFFGRVKFFFSKIKEAIFGDLVQGIGQSMVHMGEDLIFSVLNLIEVIPDATIGNIKAGRCLTTKVFDTAQVFLDYITDIVPFGDAWIRVHSMKGRKPPVYYNLSLKERESGDERWSYIRNTPFRKAIETIGSIFSDIMLIRFLGNTKLISNDHHENRNPEL